MNKILLGIFMLGAIGFLSCGKKEEAPPPAPVPAAQPAVEATPEEEVKEKPVYVYSGDRFRDPFTPAGLSSSYQPDAIFDPQRTSVKGIIFGSRLKSAVLTAGGSGTYFVKDGRIFDVMGKIVDGFKAKVLEDKVIVLGEADNIFELHIRETEELQEDKT